MREFILTYRKRYCVDLMTTKIDAYNFADAETKFNDEFQEEDDLIIVQIYYYHKTLIPFHNNEILKTKKP